MRVAILQHGDFPGYVAPTPKENAKNLARLGVDVRVITLGNRTFNGETFEFPIHCVTAKHLSAVYREISEHIGDVDLVHYYPGKKLELLPLSNRRPRFIFNHISVSVTGRFLRDKAIDLGKRMQTAFADHVLFTDAALARALHPFPRKPWSVMPVGYADDLFFPCPPSSGTVPTKKLLYHGAMRPQRRLEDLIKVTARLPKEFTLDLIGGDTPGDEAYKTFLAGVAEELRCSDRVQILKMPQVQIRAAIADAYLCMSYVPMLDCFQDQFVLKTLEYLACHRPVMTTATRYSVNFAAQMGNGTLLLTNGSVDDMVEKIMHSENYVSDFYSTRNLSTLTERLRPSTTRYLVQTRLIPTYREVLARSA